MKSVYLLLTRSETLLSKAIRRFTGDPYTHVSIAFDASLSPLYSFARKHAFLPLPAGLVKEDLQAGFFGRYHGMPCALLELRVGDAAYGSARQSVEMMMRRSGKYHYSVAGLVLCRLAVPLERRHYYFCSQFVGEILLRSGALALPKPASLMRPVDYDLMAELSCLFRGQLGTLCNRIHCSSAA